MEKVVLRELGVERVAGPQRQKGGEKFGERHRNGVGGGGLRNSRGRRKD